MSWGPIHPIIAFLLLGIGIDDMFVIVQGFQNCKKIKKKTTTTMNEKDKKMAQKPHGDFNPNNNDVKVNDGVNDTDNRNKGEDVDDQDVDVDTDSHHPSNKEIALRVATALRYVGVSITVTTLTDVLAFGFGALSTLPALRSFSIWLSLGMFSVYLLQV